ncbi:MAG: ketopantoate reductase family protein [Solirubrobacterales bacterium]|nr:ketopantoate reductase family protein [Solirubrobacterales bacterium]
MSSIVVLGPGGVGGFLAAVLARAGEDVAAVGREREAEVIAQDGISVQSRLFGPFNARLPVSTELTSQADVLLVATKAPTLPEALTRIKSAPRLVVPFLNGFEHVAALRSYFGDGRVAAGVIRMETDCPAPGHVVQSSPGVRVELAADDASLQEAVRGLAEVLLRTGLPAQIGASEAQVLWCKLVRLAPLACTTSVADRPIGFIRTDPHWRSVLLAVIGEVVAVANAEGAQIDPASPLAELESAHATLGSSMQRDLAAGREPEVEAIPGAVLRAAARHGIECPTLAGLAAAIAERAGLPVPAGL